jgi:hypothetical protein
MKRDIYACLQRYRARQVKMAPKKKESYKKPRKICWHLYSLQALNPEKFIKVIDKILRREFMVIK